jgi:hypothetical protein
MLPLDIAAIERRARRLRAEEMQRIQGLMSARMRLYGQLMGATLLSALLHISGGLFRLFSWNPQTHRYLNLKTAVTRFHSHDLRGIGVFEMARFGRWSA